MEIFTLSVTSLSLIPQISCCESCDQDSRGIWGPSRKLYGLHLLTDECHDLADVHVFVERHLRYALLCERSVHQRLDVGEQSMHKVP